MPANLLYAPLLPPRAEAVSPRLVLQAGGTLNPRRHVYIERPEDAELLRLLRAGEYVNVLTSRQMGKSSLMVRTLLALRREGVRTASVDLAAELAGRTPDTWFKGLVGELARELGLSRPRALGGGARGGDRRPAAAALRPRDRLRPGPRADPDRRLPRRDRQHAQARLHRRALPPPHVQ